MKLRTVTEDNIKRVLICKERGTGFWYRVHPSEYKNKVIIKWLNHPELHPTNDRFLILHSYSSIIGDEIILSMDDCKF